MRPRSQRSGSFRGKTPRKDAEQGSRFAARGASSGRSAPPEPAGGTAAAEAELPVFRRLADRVPEAPAAALHPAETEADLPVFLRFADRPLADAPKEAPVDAPPVPAADPQSKPELDAYRRALGLLVRREHSRRELKRKLGAKGADPAQAEAALDTLAGQGYQDDARFAEMLVRTRIGSGYGPLHIRAEMGTHGIAPDIAAHVLLEADPDWPALAIDALRRRYGTRAARDRNETLKRANYLQRRGFDVACIRAAVSVDLDD